MYKTTNIDEVVFLTVKGLRHTKIKIIADRYSEWSFEESTKVTALAKQFWSGAPTVSLNKWMVIRQAIKNEQKSKFMLKQPMGRRMAGLTVDMRHPTGMMYWFINGNQVVQEARYGKAVSNNKRIDDGNFYLTKDEAELALMI